MSASVPKPLVNDLSKAGYAWPWHEEPAGTVAEPGCYALLIRLDEPLTFRRPHRGVLEIGWYVYAGSAHGPGGIRARLARHFKRDKELHWHIDQVTCHAASLSVHDIPGGEECDLIAHLSAAYAFDSVEPGFGSTDCRLCPSHLLMWRPPDERPR